MIREAIEKIVNKGDLSYDEAYTVMNEIMNGQTSATQNAAFLAALSTKSARAETTDEIAGCAAAMREHATCLLMCHRITHCFQARSWRICSWWHLMRTKPVCGRRCMWRRQILCGI